MRPQPALINPADTGLHADAISSLPHCVSLFGPMADGDLAVFVAQVDIYNLLRVQAVWRANSRSTYESLYRLPQ